MNLSALYETMATLLVCIVAGYLARRIKLVDGNFVSSFSKLIINIFQPCMILNSVMNKVHILSNQQVFLLTAIAFGCYVALFLLSLVVPKVLRLTDDQGTYRFMFIFGNIGFMGYPVVRSLFGDDAMFNVTIFILFFNIIVYTLGVYLISGDKKHIRPSAAMFCKPSIIACFVAYVVYFLNLTVPTIPASCVGYIGDLTTPTSMILIGCSLGVVPFKSMLGSLRIYGLIAIKMILVPIVAFFLLRTIVTDPVMMGVIVVMMAMPIATNSTMISAVYGGNDKLASTGVLVSTVLSVAIIPIMMQFLFGN